MRWWRRCESEVCDHIRTTCGGVAHTLAGESRVYVYVLWTLRKIWSLSSMLSNVHDIDVKTEALRVELISTDRIVNLGVESPSWGMAGPVARRVTRARACLRDILSVIDT